MKILRFFTQIMLTILLSTFFVFATTAIVPTQEQLIVGSRIILRGTVLANVVRRDDPALTTFTYTTLKVSIIYKGTAPEEIVIKEPGGILNNFGSVIFGTPEFSVGEEVVLFLDTWPDGTLRVHQWFLGKFVISGDKISRSSGGNKVHVLNSEALNTAPEDFLAFEGRLKRNISKVRWESAKHELKFYSNQINFRPQELNSPVANFTFLNPNIPMRWFEPDTNQPVIFKVNPAGMPSVLSIPALNESLAAWSNVPGSSLRLQNSGETNKCGLLVIDGENTISFNNCDNYSPFSPVSGGCSGILAAAGIVQYSTFQTRVVNGITFYRALEGNVSFNPYASCYFTSTCVVQEIATHEIGHAGIPLGHSLDADSTMWPYLHGDGRCSGIKQDDQNGLRFIYPSNANPTPTPTPIPTQLAKRGDYDGDGKADFSVWNGLASEWKILQSSNNQLRTIRWGAAYSPWLDLAVPGDYDGDKKFDVAVFRPYNLYWLVSKSSGGNIFTLFGNSSNKLVPADYDGDGKYDFATYNNGFWQILKSSDNTTQTTQLGTFSDIPLPNDMDGDGKADALVFNAGNWSWVESSTGQVRNTVFGANGDTPVPSFYDTDRKTDLAYFRNNYWYILKSTSNSVSSFYWGANYAPYYDVLLPADYDGDGIDDVTVWRSSTGWWYGIKSSNGQIFAARNGQFGEIPVVR